MDKRRSNQSLTRSRVCWLWTAASLACCWTWHMEAIMAAHASGGEELPSLSLIPGKEIWELCESPTNCWSDVEKMLSPVTNGSFYVTDGRREEHLRKIRNRIDNSRELANGWTLLHWLIVQNKYYTKNVQRVIRPLLSLGVDPDISGLAKNRRSDRSGHYYEGIQRENIAEVLQACRVDVTPLLIEIPPPGPPPPLPGYGFQEPIHDAFSMQLLESPPWWLKDWWRRNMQQFPSISELAYRQEWWAVQNLCRRRLVSTEEAMTSYQQRTAEEWAVHHGKHCLAAELRYYFKNITLGTRCHRIDGFPAPLPDFGEFIMAVLLGEALTSFEVSVNGELEKKLASTEVSMNGVLERKLEVSKYSIQMALLREHLNYKASTNRMLESKLKISEDETKRELEKVLEDFMKRELDEKMKSIDVSMKEGMERKIISMEVSMKEMLEKHFEASMNRELDKKIQSIEVSMKGKMEKSLKFMEDSLTGILDNKIVVSEGSIKGGLEKRLKSMEASMKGGLERKLKASEGSMKVGLEKRLKSMEGSLKVGLEKKIKSLESSLKGELEKKLGALEVSMKKMLEEKLTFLEASTETKLAAREQLLAATLVEELQSIINKELERSLHVSSFDESNATMNVTTILS